MKHVNGDMTVKQVLESHPVLLDVFKKYGIGKFEDKHVLEKLGSILKLKTALKNTGINTEQFIDILNTTISESNYKVAEHSAGIKNGKDLTLLALMPCGMKMPFHRVFDNFVTGIDSDNKPFNYLIEGNVNHELSYYPYLDSVMSIDELPDVIISSDFNNFFHKKFRDEFLNKDNFASLNAEELNPDFEDLGFSDPHKHFTMLSANLLVIVALNDMIGRDLPASWKDLGSEKYTNKIAIRGDGKFFCSALLLPFYKLYGMDGIKQLARSVKTGLHPSEMVNMINKQKADSPALYVMPYFFTRKITAQDKITIIIPEEGAIISPVQMLVKKSKLQSVRELTDFLLGKNMGQVFAEAFFPSTNAEVYNSMEKIRKMYWLGWDFIYDNDIGQIKDMLGNFFLEEFSKSGGIL